ncbi:MAG: hypothetical protein ABIQ65_05610, partial [Thermoanaerobaculia bacterium]
MSARSAGSAPRGSDAPPGRARALDGSPRWPDLDVLSVPVAIALGISAQLAILRRPEHPLGIWLYAGALSVLVLGSLRRGHAAATAPGVGSRIETIAMGALLLVAVVLRLVLITTHPGIFGDE